MTYLKLVVVSLSLVACATTPLQPVQEKSEEAKRLIESGKNKGKRGDIDGALADFNRAIHLDPKAYEGYNARGVAKLEKQLYDEAAADFTKALEINPSYSKAFYNRGRLKYIMNEYAAAIEDLDEVIRLDSDEYVEAAYYFRGRSYLAVGESRKAVSDFTKGLELNPKSGDMLWARARAHGQIGEYKRGIQDLTEAIRYVDKKRWYSLYFDRSELYVAIGDYEAAIKGFKDATMLRPESEDAHLGLAMVHMLMKKPELAIQNVNRARELQPKSGYAYLLRSIGYYQKGVRREALEDLTKGRSLADGERRVRAYLTTWFLRMKMGQREQAASELGEFLKVHKGDKQSEPYLAIGRFLLEEMSAQQLRDYVNLKAGRDIECKAVSMIYELLSALVTGNKERLDLEELLGKVEKMDFKYFPEYVLAMVELDELRDR